MASLASPLTPFPVALIAAPTEVPLDTTRERVLVYAGAWISGVWYLATARQPEVRRHATLSTGIFGGITLLLIFISNAPIPFRIAFLGASAVATFGIAIWVFLLGRALNAPS